MIEFLLKSVHVRPGQHPGKSSLDMYALVDYRAEGVTKLGSRYGTKYPVAGTIRLGIHAEPQRYSKPGFVCRLSSWYKNKDECTSVHDLKEAFEIAGLNAVKGLNEAARATAQAHWNTTVVPEIPHTGQNDFATVYTTIESSDRMNVRLAGVKAGDHAYSGTFTVEVKHGGALEVCPYSLSYGLTVDSEDGKDTVRKSMSLEIIGYLMPLLLNRWQADQKIARINKVLEALKQVEEKDRQLQASYYEMLETRQEQRNALAALGALNVTQAELTSAALLERTKGRR